MEKFFSYFPFKGTLAEIVLIFFVLNQNLYNLGQYSNKNFDSVLSIFARICRFQYFEMTERMQTNFLLRGI
jgi:hypothetical protein